MVIKLSRSFKARLQGRFGRFDFEVGILNDGPHKDAKRGVPGLKGQDVISLYAGGPRRNVTGRSSTTLSEVSKANRERLGINFYTEPFKDRTSDIVKFANEFFKLAFGRTQKKRAENLLQAIVRNPILRGEYGRESALTQRIKGFSRPMIDTAQLFKGIVARCTVRGAARE